MLSLLSPMGGLFEVFPDRRRQAKNPFGCFSMCVRYATLNISRPLHEQN